MSPPPVESVVIRSGPAQAELLIGRGCTCVAAVLERRGGTLPVVWAPEGFRNPQARPSSGGIPILCPYPGRLATTTIDFQGRSFDLEPRDALGRPIHGFAHDRSWRIVEHGDDRLVADFVLSRDAPERLARWPADFRLLATWTISPRSLACRLDLEARGTMPAAFGLHPYFPLPLVPGSDPEACLLDVPARQWQPQHEWLPSGPLEPAASRIAFPGVAPLRGVVLDDVFTDLVMDSGTVRARLLDPSGAVLTVASSAVFPTCVLFTPPHRQAVCIEPYTCLPGGGAFDAARGWRILGRGERLVGEMAITLGEHNA